MAVNLRHQFFAAQAVIPGMKQAGGGSIINFGSLSWKVGMGGMPAYVTAKAAIGGLTRGLARDVGKFNIRVNTVVPGWVMTERQIRLWLDAEGERTMDRMQSLAGRVDAGRPCAHGVVPRRGRQPHVQRTGVHRRCRLGLASLAQANPVSPENPANPVHCLTRPSPRLAMPALHCGRARSRRSCCPRPAVVWPRSTGSGQAGHCR